MMRYALIDESGRLYDPEDKILVIAVLVTQSLVGLDKVIIKIRRKIPHKGKRKTERFLELKFSLSGDKTRKLILKEIAKLEAKIYLLVVDKQGRRIKDNPEHYALLISKALVQPFRKNSQLEHILIDRHFTSINQQEKFNILLQKSFHRSLFVEHLDSSQNQVITLADFIAGAIRLSYTGQETHFREMFNSLIKGETITTWKQLKSGKP